MPPYSVQAVANEKEINIADVTDKQNPVTIGRNSYPNVAYAHQGWFDAEQRYFYMNDEMDEVAGTVDGTRTIVWDLAKLDDPIVGPRVHRPGPLVRPQPVREGRPGV